MDQDIKTRLVKNFNDLIAESQKMQKAIKEIESIIDSKIAEPLKKIEKDGINFAIGTVIYGSEKMKYTKEEKELIGAVKNIKASFKGSIFKKGLNSKLKGIYDDSRKIESSLEYIRSLKAAI